MAKTKSKKLVNENNIDLKSYGVRSTVYVKGKPVKINTRMYDDCWCIDIESEDSDYMFNMHNDSYLAVKNHIKLVDYLNGGQTLENALTSLKLIDKVQSIC